MSDPLASAPPDGAELPPDEPASQPETAAAAAPPPPAVTVDLVKSIVTEAVTGVAQEFGKLLLQAQAAGQRVEAPAVAEPQDVSDAEIDAAASRGESIAPLIERRIQARLSRETKAIREEVAQLRTYGTSSLQAISDSLASADPDFKKYEKEIRAELERVDPSIRSHPEVIARTKRMVLGAHIEEIRAEEREKAARAARTPVTTAAAPGGAAGRTEPAKPTEPSLEDLFGESVARVIRDEGGIEAVAKRFNRTPDEYLKTAKEMRGYA